VKRTVVTSLTTLALACSPANVASPVDAGGDSPASTSITQACKDYAAAYCSHLGLGDQAQCSPTALAYRYGDLSTCRSVRNALCVAEINAPSSGWSAATFEACTSAIPTWGCSNFFYDEDIPPQCQVTGALPEGSACAVSAQCTTGFCAIPPGARCGTCQPTPKVGASCADVECPAGLLCEGSGPTCVGYAIKGEACGANQPCNDGLACVGGLCQTAETTLGAPCSLTTDACAFFDDGLSCDGATGMCATVLLIQPGLGCGVVDNQEAFCIAGSCLRGVCVANVPLGGACEVGGDVPCIASADCIVPDDGGTSGTCTIRGSLACP
jgi:hypothetical protein